MCGTVYAVVTAEHSQQCSCANNSAVYIAGRGRKLRLALQQKLERLPDGTVYDGNGVEAIRWSPSGDRMVVEVWQWTWGSDFGSNTKYIVLSPATEAATEIPATVNYYPVQMSTSPAEASAAMRQNIEQCEICKIKGIRVRLEAPASLRGTHP